MKSNSSEWMKSPAADLERAKAKTAPRLTIIRTYGAKQSSKSFDRDPQNAVEKLIPNSHMKSYGSTPKFYLLICFQVAFLSAVLLSQQTFAQNKTANSSEEQLYKEANELLKPWDKTDAPGVSVAIMRNSEVIYEQQYGLADLEQNAKITRNTVFQAASISKQFTAFAILLLADQEKVALDESIRTYLPSMPSFMQDITVRHLLDHVGGLREISTLTNMAGWQEDDIRTNEQYLNVLSRQTAGNFQPGDEFQYSNTGYFLLSQIVENVSEKSFDVFMNDEIFKPLEMTNSRFNMLRDDLVMNIAHSYRPYSDGFLKLIYQSENIGSTGLQTTAEDLLKWAKNFETQKVGNQDIIDKMAKRIKAKNGDDAILGRGQELRPHSGFSTWSHGGREAGYRSYLLRIPEEDLNIVVLSNRSDFNMAYIAFSLADIFLQNNEKYREEPAYDYEGASASELTEFAGNYELFPGLVFSITTDGKSLFFAQLNAGGKFELQQIGKREYQLSKGARTSLKFIANEKGSIDKLNYVLGMNGMLEARKLSSDHLKKNEHPLDDYTGRYFCEELLTFYEIQKLDDELVAKHLRLSPIPLKAYTIDTFHSTNNSFQKAEFLRDKGDNVIGVNVSGVYANKVFFEKLPTKK